MRWCRQKRRPLGLGRDWGGVQLALQAERPVVQGNLCARRRTAGAALGEWQNGQRASTHSWKFRFLRLRVSGFPCVRGSCNR